MRRVLHYHCRAATPYLLLKECAATAKLKRCLPLGGIGVCTDTYLSDSWLSMIAISSPLTVLREVVDADYDHLSFSCTAARWVQRLLQTPRL